jgi:ADP-ribose pyrophosphatase
MRKVELISRRLAFDGFFKVEEATLRFERYNGRMSDVVTRLSFLRGDSAAALLVNPRRRCVYLTEQFKYPTLDKGGGWIVEVAAGTVETGEDAEQTVRREILEEAGFAVERVEFIAEFFVSPGGTGERVFLFCVVVADADRKTRGGGVASEHEDIAVIEMPLATFLAKTAAGEFHDAKTLLAGYWLREHQARIVPP